MGHSLGSKRVSRKAAPSPAGRQVEVGRGQNPSLRIRSQAAGWLNSKKAPSAPALPEWRPGHHYPSAPKPPNKPHCLVPGREVGMSGKQQGGHRLEMREGEMEREGVREKGRGGNRESG